MNYHNIPGILLLYHHPLTLNAPTLQEHISAFQQYSGFKVWMINTTFGFPKHLNKLQFQIIVLHYSLFGIVPYKIYGKFLSYIEQCQSSYKIAFFQDEHHHCQDRFNFLNRYQIDCVYTLVEPESFKDIYQKYTKVPKLVYNLTGYVSDELISLAQKMTKPDKERQIDIGYRARQLPFYMGKGAQEKHEIAVAFHQQAKHLDLKLDIETQERQRIYGKAWYEFVANCRGVLGVEAGVSIFDTKDIVRQESEQLLRLNPKMSFAEISERLLHQWESQIFYRTISPRHFEAAALRVCQILFEGKYSGIMQPMVHYIPLKKDFSNFAQVIGLFQDQAVRHELTENAYRDLIASGKYSYQNFMQTFDNQLLQQGFEPEMADKEVEIVSSYLSQVSIFQKSYAYTEHTLDSLVMSIVPKRYWQSLSRWKQRWKKRILGE